MAPTIRRRNTFLRGDVGVDSAAIAHEAMIVNGKVRMYFGPFPALASRSAEFHLSSGTREMVADFRILRGNHRVVCVCRTGANGVAFVPAFVTLAVIGSETPAWSGSRSAPRCCYFLGIFPSTTKQSSGGSPGRSLLSILRADLEQLRAQR